MQGLLPLYRYFDFSGRSGRAEFWQFVGLMIVAIVAAFALDVAIGNAQFPLLMIGVVCLTLIPYYAVSTRRLHDRALSGRWLLLPIASALLSGILNYFAGQNAYTATGDFLLSVDRINDWIGRGAAAGLFGVCILRGDEGANAYGPPPATAADAPAPRDILDRARSVASAINAPPGTPGRVATPDIDPLEQIERLAKMRDAGVLTDDEFQQQKSAYLGRL